MRQALFLSVCVALLAHDVRAHGGWIPPSAPPPMPPARPPLGGGSPTGGGATGGGPAQPSQPLGPATGGTPTPPPPSTPTPPPPQPRTGGPTGKTTPTGGGPSGPATGGPATGGPNTGTPGKYGPTGPGTGLDFAAVDLTTWEYWWAFNKDEYLDLKGHLLADEVTTGADELLQGRDGAALGAGLFTERVIPALRGALERETHNEIVTGAMIALARSADGSARAFAADWSRLFQRFERDPSQEIAETSVLARGLVGDESSADALVALLADLDEARARYAGRAVPTRTRAFAAFGLGLLAANSRNEDLRRYAVHHLLRTLRAESNAQADVPVACVLAIGLAPLAWTDADGARGGTAVEASSARKSAPIATASREAQIECVLALLADKDGERLVRAHATTVLGRLAVGAPESLRETIANVLIATAEAAREKDEVVQGAVLALGSIGDADRDPIDVKVRAALRRLSTGSDLQSRCFALVALAQSGSRAGGAGAEEGALDARNTLLATLENGNARERTWSALALGIFEHARIARGIEPSRVAHAALRGALEQRGSSEEIGAFAIALGLARDREAVPALIARLERLADARVRGYLSLALGLIGDERAVPVLRAQLAESRFRPDILQPTAIALALLDDRTLAPTLVSTLSQATSLASQSAAASVLGWIGDRSSLLPLVELLEKRDVTASARGFAAVALGRVCDRDRRPWNAILAAGLQYRAGTETLVSADGTGLLDML